MSDIYQHLEEIRTETERLEADLERANGLYIEAVGELEWLHDFLTDLGMPAPRDMTVAQEMEIRAMFAAWHRLPYRGS